MDSREKKDIRRERERDEAKRQAFREQISQWSAEVVVYVDEAGMEHRDDYGYGWNLRGQRFDALKSGRREGRVNMIAAYCHGQLLAPFTVEGAWNRTVFETWRETCLVPTLKPAGQRVLMDNASFHKGGRIEQLIQEAGAQCAVSATLFSRSQFD